MTKPYTNVPAPTVAEIKYVFDVLTANVATGWLGQSEPSGSIPSAGHESALFVKYKLFASKGADWTLRGCMGTFEPYELKEGLAKWAVVSGSKDPRWSPITPEELPHIECTASFLSPFEDCSDYLDWNIGEHGIRIFLPEHCKPDPTHSEPALIPPTHPISATYLPEIAVEHGWTKTEAVNTACWKGGYRGTVDEALRRQLVVKRYTTRKISMTYAEYLKAKKNESVS